MKKSHVIIMWRLSSRIAVWFVNLARIFHEVFTKYQSLPLFEFFFLKQNQRLNLIWVKMYLNRKKNCPESGKIWNPSESEKMTLKREKRLESGQNVSQSGHNVPESGKMALNEDTRL